MNNGKTTKKTTATKTTKSATKKILPEKLKPGFKVDRSKAARSMSKAFAMTQKRLHGGKVKSA